MEEGKIYICPREPYDRYSSAILTRLTDTDMKQLYLYNITKSELAALEKYKTLYWEYIRACHKLKYPYPQEIKKESALIKNRCKTELVLLEKSVEIQNVLNRLRRPDETIYMEFAMFDFKEV